MMVAAGGDVNGVGKDRWTAVMRAAEAGHADVVEELVVRHGADVSARNRDNDEVAAVARRWNNREVLAVLTAAAAARRQAAVGGAAG